MFKKRLTGSECVLWWGGQWLTEVLKQKSTTTAWDHTGNPCCLWVDPACQQEEEEEEEEDGICVDSERAHTPTHTIRVTFILAPTHLLHPSHLQQLLVLVCTGESLRASGRKKEVNFIWNVIFFFSISLFFSISCLSVCISLCVCVCVCLCVCVSVRVCNGHTVWCLCVADGGHSFQGRFQRKLNVGHHWAEGGRLLCGDLHGKCINRQSQTQAPIHTHTHTYAHTHTHSQQIHRKDKYERAHAHERTDSTGKGTDDRDTEDTC